LIVDVIRRSGGEAAGGLDFWNPLAANLSRWSGDRFSQLSDFWQPPKQSGDEPSKTAGSEIIDPWWSDARAPAELIEPTTPDSVVFDLPLFDKGLAQPLFVLDVEPTETIAQRRARWLMQLLDIPEPARRAKLRAFFTELFDQFASANSFRALASIATDGISADMLVSGCRFKLDFIENADWHWQRRAGRLYVPNMEPSRVLSWARACRLAAVCSSENPADLIESDWFDEWLVMPPDDRCYWRYLDLIEEKLIAGAHGYWTSPNPLELMTYSPANGHAGQAAIGLRSSQLRSRLGQMVFSIPDVVGTLNQPTPIPRYFYGNIIDKFASRGRLLRSQAQ